jgi:hypothetical protein
MRGIWLRRCAYCGSQTVLLCLGNGCSVPLCANCGGQSGLCDECQVSQDEQVVIGELLARAFSCTEPQGSVSR